jgi:hypothetical protein
MRESPSEAWARCRPILEAAANRFSNGTIEEAERSIEAERAWFWPGPHSAAISEITHDFHIWLAGGSLPELLEMERGGEHWARAHGCRRMTVDGRKGWERVLKPLGYRSVTLLIKELT